MGRFIDTSHAKFFDEKFVYPEVGYCIYCYARDVYLTTEHTIPSGLGARHELPKASCEKCQREINTFEQYCMRTLLGNARAHFKIQSPRKRPRPPYSVRVRREDDSIERVHKPITELPIYVTLPMWPLPFALRGIPGPNKFRGEQWIHGPSDTARILSDFDAKAIVTETMRPRHFARMLAKIAHSHSIAVLGAHRFKPILPELILGTAPRYIEFVGGSMTLDPPEPAALFLMSFEILPRHTDGVPMGVFNLRLFPNIGGPTYHVVIGEMLRPWP